MGYIFSAFGWSYVVGAGAGRLAARPLRLASCVYAFSIIVWSLFTMLQGWVGFFSAGAAAVAVLFALRLLVGVAEAPSFPANARIVAAWFPGNERGTASAFFNSAQYFATVLFAPLMGWIAHALRLALRVLRDGRARHHHGPRLDQDRLRPEGASRRQRGRVRLHQGGRRAGRSRRAPKTTCRRARRVRPWDHIRQLLANRMLLGVYHRPVLHQHADLFLPDLVPGLPRQGARPVDPASRLRRDAARRCAASSAACSAASSPTPSCARPAR